MATEAGTEVAKAGDSEAVTEAVTEVDSEAATEVAKAEDLVVAKEVGSEVDSEVDSEVAKVEVKVAAKEEEKEGVTVEGEAAKAAVKAADSGAARAEVVEVAEDTYQVS